NTVVLPLSLALCVYRIMSILIPTNLSGPPHRVKEKQEEVPSQESSSVSGSGNSARPATTSAGMGSQEESQAPAAVRKPGLERETSDTSPRDFGNSVTATPVTKSDEYGAELGKEARVWHVYVKETDRWDAELVEGWNKSLDVILVFAALFAAVATAFLIESSKQLQPDPSQASTEALYLISQTLLVIASNNRTLQPDTLPSVNSTLLFQPTQHAIVINTLWYLSLSLSIAASLMAMFAKDWCHSFITSRHGDPWLQARRRQQKWNMIECWKMQELLLVLPSLIHLSLLLFAVGLCIYVHDLNSTVAIPVIVVTIAGGAFYIVSSAMAFINELFPYTTILSKVLSSVAIALQAIAGANANLPRPPLQECQATLHILRRLVSYKLEKLEDFSFVQTALYSRALRFLGDQVGDTGEIGVMIWDLQVENEKQVVKLIAQEKFDPSNQNIQALRIGSSAASTSLQLLNEATIDWSARLDTLHVLLSDHLAGSRPLHCAAVTSLIHAAGLFYSCSGADVATQRRSLLNNCVQLLHHRKSNGLYWHTKAAILVAIISQGQPNDPLGSLASHDTLSRARVTVRALNDIRKWGSNNTKIFALLGELELIQGSIRLNKDNSRNTQLEPTFAPTHIRALLAELACYSQTPTLVKGIILPLRTNTKVNQSTSSQAPALSISAYLFILDCICNPHAQDVRPGLFSDLLSATGFPTFSEALMRKLEHHRTIATLRKALAHAWTTKGSSPYESVIAIIQIVKTQLWLILTVISTRPDGLRGLEWVTAQLGGSESFDLTRQRLASEILTFDPDDVYLCRVMECVTMTDGKEYKSSDVQDKVNQTLVSMSPELRGTPYPIKKPSFLRRLVTSQPIEHIAMTVYSDPES
ncbi:unnamed protein product, partial [Rhizoctonia solani]